MVRWLWGWLVVVLCLSSGVMAAEGEAPPQEQIKADPLAIWRVMGRTDQESSSDCIGQTDSLSCTIDTVTACLVREDMHYCHLAIQNFPDIKFRQKPSNIKFQELGGGLLPYSPTPYRIDAVRQVQKPERLRPPSQPVLQLSPFQAEPGDWIVELYQENLNNAPYILVLRQTGQQWRVLVWYENFIPRWKGYKAPNPRPDLPWKLVAGWNSLSSSTCIGRTDTPICAVETFLACELRNGFLKCLPSADDAINMMDPRQNELSSNRAARLCISYKIDKIKRLASKKNVNDASEAIHEVVVHRIDCNILSNLRFFFPIGDMCINYQLQMDGNRHYVDYWEECTTAGR